MRYVIFPALLLLAFTPPQASAQSESAFAGWASLVATPVGGFAPSVYAVPSSPDERRWGAQARYGHWQFAADDDNTTNLGLGLAFAVGEGRLGVDVGRTTKKDCDDCDALLLGASLDVPLASMENGLAVVLNPELGLMSETGDSDFSAVAAAVNVALSYAIEAGDNVRVMPFVAPGAGFGRISSGGDSETGQRFMLGGGVGILSEATGLQVTASASKIFIDGGETVFGVTLGIGR